MSKLQRQVHDKVYEALRIIETTDFPESTEFRVAGRLASALVVLLQSLEAKTGSRRHAFTVRKSDLVELEGRQF